MVDYLTALLLFRTPSFHIIGCKYYDKRGIEAVKEESELLYTCTGQNEEKFIL